MTLTHRRQTSELSNGWVILFAEDEDRNRHYGPHRWDLLAELPNVWEDESLIKFAAAYLGADIDEAVDAINPDNIVSSAGLWDDPQFVSELYHISGLNVIGWRTWDGAVVLDRDAVKMQYKYDPETI